ncbi:pyroglutamyl-peptidase [Evansella caseinilytica]|uniref:Pyroglutamyl-peptidase I n=1 Tax=Evansella caseinilytica TaxID=1503961 RepID=A0A1H3PNH2_9BACI|nr:pyroglutamyl-peptidase I [Evansella caseinilytica]SDZ02812.1 pyroglutamyl-peptidase [Evansella caseinilytica]
MKKILLSGFEPFGNLTTNPTMELVSRAGGWNLENGVMETIILPVVYNECADKLIDKIEVCRPDIVLSLGVAVGRAAITPERIAMNIQDTAGEGKAGDNRGDKPQDRLIAEDGPDGLFTTLPIRDLTTMLQQAGIPAQISNTAGTYICNNTMYSTLYHLQKHKYETKAGFIHVPATPEMIAQRLNMPSMSLELQEKALYRIVETLLLPA